MHDYVWKECLEKDKAWHPNETPVPWGGVRPIPRSQITSQFAKPRTTTYQQFSGNLPVPTPRRWPEECVDDDEAARLVVERVKHMREGHAIFCFSEGDRARHKATRLRAELLREREARREAQWELDAIASEQARRTRTAAVSQRLAAERRGDLMFGALSARAPTGHAALEAALWPRRVAHEW